MASIISVLIAFAPLIMTLGFKMIDMFVTNADEKMKAKVAFLNAIQLHVNDHMQSLNAHESYQQQKDELQKSIEQPVSPEQGPKA